MVLPLRYYGDKILRQKCTPVAEITKEILSLIDEMIATMDSKQAIGLAAPQVGYPLRIFVIRSYEPTRPDHYHLAKPEIYINPILSLPTVETEVLSEGCLSFPGLHIEVERPLGITVEALGRDGKSFVRTLNGFHARQIMHENDHINGTLFIDRIPSSYRKRIDRDLARLKKRFN